MFMYEIYDRALYEQMFIFIKAYDEYEAEARYNELFPSNLYEGEYIDEYDEAEAELLGYDIF